MLSIIWISAALLAGYLVAVVLSLVVTLGIGSAFPGSVVENYRVRNGYKLLQDGIWLVCATAAGYVTALVADEKPPLLVGGLLAGILVGVLWANSWESRQRGMAHQILISVASVAGVTIGFLLKLGMKS
jgi:hypothetical protein